MMLSFGNRFRLLLLVGGLQIALPCRAQKCPASQVNERALVVELRKIGVEDAAYFPNNPDISGPQVDTAEIYRLSAIGGVHLIPALRRLSKPGMPNDSVPAAAQVSLAKLEDVNAFHQIVKELKTGGKEHEAEALSKLGRLGNDQAAAVLIDHYLEHISDVSDERAPHIDIDTDNYIGSSDWLRAGLDVLEPYLKDPPALRFGTQQWEDWCQKNKSGHVTWIVHTPNLFTFRQRCLVRKIRWGFSDAILDLAADDDKRVIPVLKELAQVGYKESRTSAFEFPYYRGGERGKAQTALAKLGDDDEFNAIIKELDTQGYLDAMAKLRFIGGLKVAQAFVNALASKTVSPDQDVYSIYRPPGQILDQRKDRDDLIAAALKEMIVVPPETASELKNKEDWIAWWAKNKDTAQFVKPPVRTYE